MAQKKMPYIKKVLIIGGAITLMQVITLWRLKSGAQEAISLKEYMAKVGMEEGNGSSATNIQIAISDFRIRKGELPKSLDELVPDYFESVPIDPLTNAPYDYKIVGDTYVIGAKATAETTYDTITTAQNGFIASGSQEESDLLVASLGQDVTSVKVYDSSTRKDPFVPYDFSPKEAPQLGSTPLERIPYENLRLSAVLLGFEEPKAIIEDDKGKGYTVNIGTKIGTEGGEIRKIEQGKITILESVIDFTGEKKTRLVELKIVKPEVTP